MENGKQSEWKAGQNAKEGEKNHFALETVFVRIYNVLVTATANAELMKRFRLFSFGSAARPESAKRAKRVI